MSYSSSLLLALQIAAAEAVQARLKFIEADQMLIALLKVADLLKPELREQYRLELNQVDLDILRRELEPLDEALAQFGLDRVQLRRQIRASTSPGTYTHPDGTADRSAHCKGRFRHAEEIAMAHHSLTLKPMHIFTALLEQPGEAVKSALSHFGVTAEALWLASTRDGEREMVAAGSSGTKDKEKRKSSTPFLDRFGADLTRLAAEGKIEPMIGRRDELLQTVRTLARKTKNNPVLVGDPGVGKTAIVRGLALRIAQGNIAPSLQKRRVIELNMAGLVAGTKYRGDFEERIQTILNEGRNSPDVILFIDELHTMIGAGRAEGSMDAANIMKPALASGEIRCIGATTLSEYRRYIEKDPALERRLQPIQVSEPSEADTVQILTGLKAYYENHHKVVIMPGVVEAAVRLSTRYLPERHLPDKALDVLDEACCRVKIDRLSYYGSAEGMQERSGVVTGEMVSKVLADWTGRPVEKPGEEEQEKLASLEEVLSRRVIGQDNAIRQVSRMIRMSRAGLRDPRRPAAVFLFLGPTGVGKTELATALAQSLFGRREALIRLDMSEFMEPHSVAKLTGAPPGYVGYEEEGQLTGKLRTNPYSVVLLDEIEKAHLELLQIFLQLFDEGRLSDAKGRTVDARNAIFIMTSNLGSEGFQKRPLGFGSAPEKEAVLDVMSHLKQRMRPEFLNRIDEIVVFEPLDPEALVRIAKLMCSGLEDRLREQGITLTIEQEALARIAIEAGDHRYGARYLSRALERLISRPLADQIISGGIKARDHVHVVVENGAILFRQEGGAR